MLTQEWSLEHGNPLPFLPTIYLVNGARLNIGIPKTTIEELGIMILSSLSDTGDTAETAERVTIRNKYYTKIPYESKRYTMICTIYADHNIQDRNSIHTTFLRLSHIL
jgi:hypothetical protein